MSTLHGQPLIAFLATTDAARARRFYGEVLGLALVAEDDYALVFEVQGTMLRIQKVERFEPQPFTALGWQVADVGAIVEQLTQRKVVMDRYPGLQQDGRGVWSSPSGARIAWFKDPDGNTLSLTEL